MTVFASQLHLQPNRNGLPRQMLVIHQATSVVRVADADCVEQLMLEHLPLSSYGPVLVEQLDPSPDDLAMIRLCSSLRDREVVSVAVLHTNAWNGITVRLDEPNPSQPTNALLRFP